MEAVQGKLEVYLDGGIREGTDVFKALALGAKMVMLFLKFFHKRLIIILLIKVFMGRPAIWGLAHSGEEGVKKVLDTIKKEFDHALALSG